MADTGTTYKLKMQVVQGEGEELTGEYTGVDVSHHEPSDEAKCPPDEDAGGAEESQEEANAVPRSNPQDEVLQEQEVQEKESEEATSAA